MPDFIQTAVKDIDDQLRALKDETSRLEAARAALAGPTGRRGRPSSNGTARTRARSASRRNGRPAAPRSRGGNTRANQTLELVREQARDHHPGDRQGDEDRTQLPLPPPPAAGVKRPGQARRPGLAPAGVLDIHAYRARAQADTRRQAQAGAVGDSARADSARRRLEVGDQRPHGLTAPPSRRCSRRSPAVRR